MPGNEINRHPQKISRRFIRERFSWLWSSGFGYIAGICFIGVILLLEKLDEAIPQAPIFVGTPFALLAVLMALLWGVGPALFTMVLGLLVVGTFISPGVLAPDLLKDITIDGPFLLMQLLAIGVVIYLERSRKRLLQAHLQLESTHQALEDTHRKLVQSTKQLERANDLKDYIITRASHELRTPVTTILGRTQLLAARLKKSAETPENWAALQKYVEVMEVRTLHLRALIESLFDLSRIRAKEIPLQHHLVDLGTLCQQVVVDQRALSERAIELELPPHGIVLQGNEELFSELLVNLLSNALKYSPEDSAVRVSANVEESGITLQVHNESPALTPEQLDHLFDPFYRTVEVEYSSVPGWGLGLTICKEIVEQYEGHIWAESPEGKGITFFVAFPHPASAELSPFSRQSSTDASSTLSESSPRSL